MPHELDLFIPHRGRRYGFEFTFTEAPTATRSMRVALDDLGLDHVWIVHPGTQTYRLDDRITAWPLRSQRRLALSAR